MKNALRAEVRHRHRRQPCAAGDQWCIHCAAGVGGAAQRVSEVFASQIDLGTTSLNGVKILRGSGTP